MANKVLETTQTTGKVFDEVPNNFGVSIILPSGTTMPDNVYLEFAISRIDEVDVADADLVWKRRHSTPFADDSGSTSGQMIKLFNHLTDVKYRMVADTAGIEAVIVTVY